MEASYPFLRPRSYDDYHRNIDNRVREPDMNTAATYSFMGEVSWSRHGDFFEFPAEIYSIRHHDSVSDGLARASLSLLILNNNKSPLISLDSETEDGIIIPTQRRISHDQYGNIGTITKGYFVNPLLAPTAESQTALQILARTFS